MAFSGLTVTVGLASLMLFPQTFLWMALVVVGAMLCCCSSPSAR